MALHAYLAAIVSRRPEVAQPRAGTWKVSNKIVQLIACHEICTIQYTGELNMIPTSIAAMAASPLGASWSQLAPVARRAFSVMTQGNVVLLFQLSSASESPGGVSSTRMRALRLLPLHFDFGGRR